MGKRSRQRGASSCRVGVVVVVVVVVVAGARIWGLAVGFLLHRSVIHPFCRLLL